VFCVHGNISVVNVQLYYFSSVSVPKILFQIMITPLSGNYSRHGYYVDRETGRDFADALETNYTLHTLHLSGTNCQSKFEDIIVACSSA
jgi:hypothetical protein